MSKTFYNVPSFTSVEKEQAKELEKLLEDLMKATDLFQADGVTSSCVYPVIHYLKVELIRNINSYKHTQTLRIELVKSICKRFGPLMFNDVFRFATFLDPHFGHESFREDERASTILRLREHCEHLAENNPSRIISTNEPARQKFSSKRNSSR
jgi:hypothetical protein